MRNKEFIPYEQALALQQLGFNEECFGTWFELEGKYSVIIRNNLYGNDLQTPSPLRQQSFRFFREKYEWQHSIEPTADQHSHQLGYNYWIWNYKTGEEYHTMPKNRPSGDWEYKTYEEAELECLKKLIEIVKEKK
jgi:hypothetical protein